MWNPNPEGLRNGAKQLNRARGYLRAPGLAYWAILSGRCPAETQPDPLIGALFFRSPEFREARMLGWNLLPDWAKLTVSLEIAAISAFMVAYHAGWLHGIGL